MKVYIVLILVFLAACTATQVEVDTDPQPGGTDSEPEKPQEEVTAEPVEEADLSWQEQQVVDVLTGESYSIADFAGTPVLIESFAVWCPTCTRQQRETKELHEDVGDDIISVAWNTDANEDAARVKSHAESNGFDWRYSVAPAELTQTLIDEFGIGIITAPSVPMILVCPDQTYRKLPNGVKSPEDLKQEVAACA